MSQTQPVVQQFAIETPWEPSTTSSQTTAATRMTFPKKRTGRSYV